jgi:Holliday junction resolvasome RuvABC endonuclease subunit
VKALVEPYSDPWVFIEAPIVWGSKASTLLLGQVSGALIAAAGVAGAERVEMVNSSTWKKQVVGNGAAKKPEIARFVHQHWPKAWDMSNSDPDLMDSACIVQYGLQMWNRKLHVEELHQRDEQQTTGHRRMATPVRRPLRRITRP